MFIDTSVLVAILAGEEDELHWRTIISENPGASTSPLVLLEAVMRLSSKLDLAPELVLERLGELFDKSSITVDPIEAAHATLAVDAFARFGKGRGHPAQLNLADCLSYACAKSRGVPLLYKGDDFAHTDLK